MCEGDCERGNYLQLDDDGGREESLPPFIKWLWMNELLDKHIKIYSMTMKTNSVKRGEPIAKELF